MEEPVDPRVELAAERTMLAWIRTGLSMMGFGFVVARFGMFLREIAAVNHQPAASAHSQSLAAGVALVTLGSLTLILGLARYHRMLRRLRSGQAAPLTVGPTAVIALALTLVGLYMIFYLIATAR